MTSPNRTTWTFAARDEVSDAFADQARAGQRTERVFGELDRRAKQMTVSFTTTEQAASKLTRELAQAERQARQLDRAMGSLGGGLAPAAGGRQRDSRGFLGGSSPAGKAAGGGRGAGLFGRALGSPLMPIGVGAGIALSPVIGATVNAAILSGLGGGALAAGIASAVRDPAVAAAFKPLRDEANGLFDDIGRAYKIPTVAAATELRIALADIRTDWAKGIGGLADLVAPLSRGLGGLARESSPGLLKMLTAAKPIIADLSVLLPGLGEDLDTMFESFASGGEGAREGMRLLVQTLGDLAVATGETVEFLSKAYDVLSDIAERTPFLVSALGPLWLMMGRSNKELETTPGLSKQATDAFNAVAQAARNTKVDLAGLSQRLNDLATTGQSMRLATLDVKDALAELSKAATENGTSLSLNSDKGRDNLRVIEAIISASSRAGEAAEKRALAEGKSAEQAALAGARVREGWIRELEASARAAGFSADQIARMVSEAKKADGTTIRTYLISTEYRGIVNTSEAMAVRLGRRAAGGPVEPGEAYVVGESGPEVLVMGDRRGRVVPNHKLGAAGAKATAEDITVSAPLVVQLEGQEVWQGLLRFKRRNGLTSLGLA